MQWFTVSETLPNGAQRILFDGRTSKELAIGRARIYADATSHQMTVQVFRGKSIGRLIYELRRDQ